MLKNETKGVYLRSSLGLFLGEGGCKTNCPICHQKLVCDWWSEQSRCSSMEELLYLLASLRQVWRGSPPSPEQFPSPLDAAHGSSGVELTHPFLRQARVISFWVFTLHYQWKTLSHPGKPNSPYLVSEGRRCLIPLHKVSRIQQLQLRHIFFSHLSRSWVLAFLPQHHSLLFSLKQKQQKRKIKRKK